MQRGGGRGGGGSGGRGGSYGGGRGFGSYTGQGRGGRPRQSTPSYGGYRRAGGYFGPPVFGPRMFGGGRPIIINNNGPRKQRPQPQGSGGGGGSSGGGSGCLSLAAVLILFALVMVFILNLGAGSGSGSIASSTVEREPLASSAVNETDYYTDQAGWIKNSRQLEEGMRKFYSMTGVQPHLFIDDEPPAKDPAEVANDIYNDLFNDEGHLLVYFYDPYNGSQYISYTLTGSQAKQVVDQEAVDILNGYIDRYYPDESMSIETAFSKAFADAADRMMTVTRSPWPIVIGIFGIGAIVFLLYLWWKRKKEEEAREAERTKEILSQPLQTYQDQNFEDLVKRYDEKDDSTDSLSSSDDVSDTWAPTALEDPELRKLEEEYDDNHQGGHHNG